MAYGRPAEGGIGEQVFSVYILRSQDGRHYVGQTANLEDRLRRHKAGFSKSTRFGRPWILVYCERFDNRADAIRREGQIKAYKGGEAFRKLLMNGGVA